MTTATTALIAEQNDLFRRYGPLAGLQGRMFTTAGVAALPDYLQATILIKVQAFASFTEDNDPHGEHDFGAFEVEGAGKVFWKIDYFADRKMEFGSEDPADLAQCFRVLTVMLASEY